MLIRIGDEKREMIEQHLENLKGKCIDTEKHEVDTKEEMQATLCQVVHNLPQKVLIYAALVALIAKENAQLAKDLIDTIVQSLKKIFVNDQDAFRSRNVFRFLSYLVDLRVICAKEACQFILNILDEYQKAAENFQGDLVLHCVLVFLTTENTCQRLQKETSIDFGTILETVKGMFKNRAEKELVKREIFGFSKPDSLTQLWKLYSDNQTKCF